MNLITLLIPVASLTCFGMANAQSSGPSLKLSGFGTIGQTQTNSNDGVYTTGAQNSVSSTQGSGATYEKSFAPDSKVGLQLDGKIDDRFSGTLQLLTAQGAKSEARIDVEWAFLKTNITNGLDIRVGRMGAPYFMISDYRNVGYTAISLRSPVEVYGLVPFRSFDGADILFRTDIKGVNVDTQLWAGTANQQLGRTYASGDINISSENSVGLSVSIDLDPVVVRAGYMTGTLKTDGAGLNDFNNLLAGLRGASAGFPSLGSLANSLATQGKAVSFSGLGATYDKGNVLVSAEYVVRTTDTITIPSANAYYVTTGYRLGNVTPYFSYSRRSQTSAKTAAETGASGPDGLINGANSAGLSDISSSTIATGLRWDFAKNVNVKAEIAQTKTPAGAVGIYRDVKGGSFTDGATINVYSVAVDYIF